MVQQTPETVTVSPDDLIVVDDAMDMADSTTTDPPLAEKVLDIVDRRARGDAPNDHIVILEGWAHEPWSDYQIARGAVLLAGKIDDYSAKALKLEGAFEIDTDVLETKSADEVHDTSLSALVHQVDETDEDFIDDVGEMFVPKSAVDEVVVVDN